METYRASLPLMFSRHRIKYADDWIFLSIRYSDIIRLLNSRESVSCKFGGFRLCNVLGHSLKQPNKLFVSLI